MRLKAVADTVSRSVGGASPLVLVGLAALGVGATYYVVTKTQATQSASDTTNQTVPNIASGFTNPNAPISLGGIGPSMSSGADTIGSIVGSSTTDTGGGGAGAVASVTYDTSGGGLPASFTTAPFPMVPGLDPASSELLAQERIKQENQFTYNMTALAVQAQANAYSAYLQSQYVESMNYQAAAGVASTFMMSQNQSTMGVITGPDGTPIFDIAMMQNRNSSKNGWNNTLEIALDRGDFSKFWNSIPGVVNQGGQTTPSKDSKTPVAPAPTGPPSFDPFAPFREAAATSSYAGSSGAGNTTTTKSQQTGQTVPSAAAAISQPSAIPQSTTAGWSAPAQTTTTVTQVVQAPQQQQQEQYVLPDTFNVYGRTYDTGLKKLKAA